MSGKMRREEKLVVILRPCPYFNMNLGGEPVNDSFDPESDGVPQITDVSYKTLTEHVTGHFRSALKVLLSSACFREDALDNAETFLCDTA